VLAHHCSRLFPASSGEFQVAVPTDGEQTIAFHASHRLRHRRPRVPQALRNARAQRNNALFNQLIDSFEVHLGGVDQIAHSDRPPEKSATTHRLSARSDSCDIYPLLGSRKRKDGKTPVTRPEQTLAFHTAIAEPDPQGGVLLYRGVDVASLIGKIPYEAVWGLLVDNARSPGLPAAEPFPLPARTGDMRVDIQSALAQLAPVWAFRPLLDIDLRSEERRVGTEGRSRKRSNAE